MATPVTDRGGAQSYHMMHDGLWRDFVLRPTMYRKCLMMPGLTQCSDASGSGHAVASSMPSSLSWWGVGYLGLIFGWRYCCGPCSARSLLGACMSFGSSVRTSFGKPGGSGEKVVLIGAVADRHHFSWWRSFRKRNLDIERRNVGAPLHRGSDRPTLLGFRACGVA